MNIRTYDVIMFEYSYNSDLAEKRAVDFVRRTARFEDVSLSALAQELKINRATLSSRFNNGGMKLNEFLELCRVLRLSPSEVLSRAESAEPSNEV